MILKQLSAFSALNNRKIMMSSASMTSTKIRIYISPHVHFDLHELENAPEWIEDTCRG